MCFLAQEKAGKEKASLGQQPLHPGRQGREQGDRGEDPQVVEANSSSSGTFSSEILMLGDCFTCNAYNSQGIASLEDMFLYHCLPSSQPSQSGSPSWFRRHTGILFPTDQTRVGGLGLPELQWLPPLPGHLDQQAQIGCFPAPDFQRGLRGLSLALWQKVESWGPLQVFAEGRGSPSGSYVHVRKITPPSACSCPGSPRVCVCVCVCVCVWVCVLKGWVCETWKENFPFVNFAPGGLTYHSGITLQLFLGAWRKFLF